MIRRMATALAGTAVLAAAAGCAHQEPFGLPDLTPRGAVPGAQALPGYGYGYGGGYPYGYQPGYGNLYGYANPWYGVQGPYPYGYVYGYGHGYGYAYSPYPRPIVVPCADNDRDGRCDTRPPKKHREQDQDGGDRNVNVDAPVRPYRNDRGEAPWVRDRTEREAAPTAQRRAMPAPVPSTQPPSQARPEPRRATPPETAYQRGPGAGRGRPATAGDDASPRPAQEP